MQGLIGKKIGMTRFFDTESGQAIPVTVIQAGPNVVHQLKTSERDGYDAVQLGFGSCPESKVSKPMAGHFRKHGSEPTRIVKEFRLGKDSGELKEGEKVGVEVLEGVRFVDVTGTTKGRGFAGTIKKYHFQRGRETHGNKNHRERGSLGAGTYPGRVFPGLKMAGQMGSCTVTTRGLEVVGIDKEAGLVYLRGAVPGAGSGIVFLRKNNKKAK